MKECLINNNEINYSKMKDSLDGYIKMNISTVKSST